jgi:hypothetical protein
MGHWGKYRGMYIQYISEGGGGGDSGVMEKESVLWVKKSNQGHGDVIILYIVFENCTIFSVHTRKKMINQLIVVSLYPIG